MAFISTLLILVVFVTLQSIIYFCFSLSFIPDERPDLAAPPMMNTGTTTDVEKFEPLSQTPSLAPQQQQQQQQQQWGQRSNNGKTTTVFVVSLQDVPGTGAENDHRMDRFREGWNQICYSNSSINSDKFVIEQCSGVLDEAGYRGYGVTQAFIRCLDRAMETTNQEMTMFFEDDARLFDSKFCRADYRAYHFQQIPSSAYLVLLGGHQWNLKDQGGSDVNQSYKQALASAGAYGFAVPRANLKALRDDFHRYLTNDTGFFLRKKQTLSPDVKWYQFAQERKQEIYVLDPLVVWHTVSYSNTWKKPRDAIQWIRPVDIRPVHSIKRRNGTRRKGQ